MRILSAACVILAMTAATAGAQPVPPESPPPGTLATIHQSHAQDALGDRRDHESTTYRSSQGVTKDSTSSSVSVPQPPPPPVTSTTSSATATTSTPR